MLPCILKCTFINTTFNICKGQRYRYIFTASKLKTMSTVDADELKKFESRSNEWWNGKEYKMLHLYNSVRVPLVRDGILSVAKIVKRESEPLKGFTILDVGCGGGILSEALAQLGAKVTGLDPGRLNIKAATEHAEKNPDIKDNLTYICDTAENLVSSDNKYDAVIASEVVEHVSDVQTFVKSCVELTKENGSLFFTTINKTNLSYFLTILMAEFVLSMVPKGTHDWNKFVKPEELTEILESLNCKIISNEGMMYNPITRKFFWCKNTSNLYSLHAVKM